MEPDDPPRKNYGFKVREFKRDNQAASGEPPMPTAKEMAIMAGPVVKSPTGATGPKADDPNDVYNSLQKNRAIEQKLGLHQVEIKKVKSRRKFDFWVVLVGGNLAIITLVAVLGLNPATFVFGLAGLIIFSLGLSWIMWQVMDRY
jgi:hypothetical protein